MNIKQNQKKKQKGFYTALGISLAMVIAACYYSYSNDMKKDSSTAEVPSETEDLGVNRIQENIPKIIETETESTNADETENVIFPQTETEAPTDITESTETSVSVLTAAAVVKEEATSHSITMPLENDPEIIQEFSFGELVKSETTGCWQTHNGVDFKAAKGDKVFAADSGAVVSVAEDGLLGLIVEIDHENGFISRYCGMNTDIKVSEGGRVESGQEIGSVGDVPEIEISLDSHFHFEVLENGKYIDPVSFLKGN